MFKDFTRFLLEYRGISNDQNSRDVREYKEESTPSSDQVQAIGIETRIQRQVCVQLFSESQTIFIC